MIGASSDFLHGTLDVLILKTLSWGPRHGYAIAKWLESGSGDTLQIEDGSLYPALYRLEHQGLIDSEWGTSENNRRAKYYRLTAAGRRRLGEEAAGWRRLADAIALALAATPGALPEEAR